MLLPFPYPKVQFVDIEVLNTIAVCVCGGTPSSFFLFMAEDHVPLWTLGSHAFLSCLENLSIRRKVYPL